MFTRDRFDRKRKNTPALGESGCTNESGIIAQRIATKSRASREKHRLARAYVVILSGALLGRSHRHEKKLLQKSNTAHTYKDAMRVIHTLYYQVFRGILVRKLTVLFIKYFF